MERSILLSDATIIKEIIIMSNFYWRIADGRIWSAAEGVFVAELPEEAKDVTPNGPDDQPMTYHGLPWLINFYNEQGFNFQLGELAEPDGLIK